MLDLVYLEEQLLDDGAARKKLEEFITMSNQK